jgi:hypothetical protein
MMGSPQKRFNRKEQANHKDQEEDLEQLDAQELLSENIAIEHTSFKEIRFLVHLFFGKKFFVHRIVGLFYLLQFFTVFVLYWFNFEYLKKSPLLWTMPATGVLQSITAIYTFSFLPKKTVDQGYFSDKYTMNYPFVVENSFFALILLFAFLYFDDYYYEVLKQSFIVEAVFVFFPYVLRQLWPKTRFRDSLQSSKGRTEQNDVFFRFGIQLTKHFYTWGKHYIGFYR